MAQMNRNVCTRCQKMFASAAEHVSHLHRSSNHHLCRTCYSEKDFKTFKEYREHVRDAHLGCLSCAWPAPSDIGLRRHRAYMHNICAPCERYFGTAHENSGHCQLRAPRSVECVGCDQKFHTLSANFNHLESSNCESGIKKEDIEKFYREYLNERDVAGLYCPSCEREFGRMCDLMQHAETPSCREGYWRGSGSVGQLVEYILSRLRTLVLPKDVILHYDSEE